MSIPACLLTGLLIGAAPAPPADPPVAPRLEKGLEVIWRGTFTEAVLRPNVRAFRAYEVETRVFVWDVSEAGADVALFTSIKLKPDVKVSPEPPAIVRLHLARVAPDGKLSLLGAEALDRPAEKRQPSSMPPMTLEGLPTLEPGLFVAFPPGKKVQPGLAWDAAEEKRPALVCRVEGSDSVRGARCWKVAANQQTTDWDRPRHGATAWRRGEKVWVSPAYGYVMRLERTVEKNDPQTGDLGFRSELVYEHKGALRYPGRFGEDRKEEVTAAARFAAEYDQLLTGQEGPRGFEPLVQRIEQHESAHLAGEAVPYRAAVLAVRRKAESAVRGHVPPAPPPPEVAAEPGPLVVGKPAADVSAKDLAGDDVVRLGKLRGRPVVLLYYQPSSARTAAPVLRFAQDLHERFHGRAAVLPLAIGNSDAALRQRNDLKLTVPVLAGRDVYKAHGIASAPSFAVLDGTGVVRSVTVGWSDENAAEVRAALEKLVK